MSRIRQPTRGPSGILGIVCFFKKEHVEAAVLRPKGRLGVVCARCGKEIE